MATLMLSPLPGAGLWARVRAWVRGLFSRRLLLRLMGLDAVVLEGRTYAVRAVPLGVARDLVPALLRCSTAVLEDKFNEALFDDIIKALSLGLGESPRAIESLSISLWATMQVLDRIARVNGLQTEADKFDPGKLLAAMARSTGTGSTPSSSPPPAGRGTTSTNS